ncbi:MAG: response regulator [Melioribacteraceae bacterium]|nr:response regulator [Melioribacteraceae bacterium]
MINVLLIEDDVDNRKNTKRLLELNHFQVTEAADGIEGLELALNSSPDIIVSDIMLPGIDGFQIKEEIDKRRDLRQVPFLFLSAKTDLNDIRRGMNLGADDYLTKPFKYKDLLAAIELRLQKHKELKSMGRNVDYDSQSVKSRIMIFTNKTPLLIEIRNIVFIIANGEYSTIYTNNSKKFIVRKLLKEWERNLPKEEFIRIHRSTIINMNFINQIKKINQRNYQVALKGFNDTLQISQRYAQKIKKLMGV